MIPRVKSLEDKVKEAVASYKALQPPLVDNSKEATQPIVLPLETEISLIQEERSPRRTYISGFGVSVRRPPNSRGGSSTTRIEVEELSRLLKESEENRVKDKKETEECMVDFEAEMNEKMSNFMAPRGIATWGRIL